MASSNDTIARLVALVSKNDAGLAGFTPDDISAFIDLMRPSVSDSLGDLGLALAVCHELTLTARGGSGRSGMVTSEREGQLARTYAAVSAIDPYWAGTAYGLRFAGLVARTILPAYNRQLGYLDGTTSMLLADCDE